MSTETDAALRAAAEAATPGPWISLRSGRVGVNGRIVEIVADTYPTGNGPKHNAEFIAAANPAAILDLLDRAEVAEAKVARVEALRPTVTYDWSNQGRTGTAEAVPWSDLHAALGDPQ